RGGWTLAIGKNTKNADAAWDFLSTAVNKDNATAYGIDNSQIAVRADVAKSSEYSTPTRASRPSRASSTPPSARRRGLRQDLEPDPRSRWSVMTGQSSVDDAAAAYDQAVIGIVGEDNTQQG
ncbi:sugar ABC transporter substrate-binding protein, partial [Microbacterium sp. SUBG005]